MTLLFQPTTSPPEAAPEAPITRPARLSVPLDEAAARLGGDAATWRAASRLLPVRWPEAYLQLAEGPAGAPLRAMGSPHADELAPQPGELRDPVGEAALAPVPHVVRKHPDRAILLVTAACHFYCRFCFRRTFPDGTHAGPSPAALDAALDHLAREADLREVILSGGDPLTLSDDRLEAIVARCASMPQVERIRIHSRAPVHEPSRVTPALAARLSRAAAGRPLRLVTHPNHAVELTTDFERAVRVVADAGVDVSTQSVLLRGVNDSVADLAALFDGLARRGVRPYYLHHPDRVAGAARFFVSVARGLALWRELRRSATFPLPSYVLDVPDGSGKIPVESLAVVGEGRWRAPHGHEWDDVAES